MGLLACPCRLPAPPGLGLGTSPALGPGEPGGEGRDGCILSRGGGRGCGLQGPLVGVSAWAAAWRRLEGGALHTPAGVSGQGRGRSWAGPLCSPAGFLLDFSGVLRLQLKEQGRGVGPAWSTPGPLRGGPEPRAPALLGATSWGGCRRLCCHLPARGPSLPVQATLASVLSWPETQLLGMPGGCWVWWAGRWGRDHRGPPSCSQRVLHPERAPQRAVQACQE